MDEETRRGCCWRLAAQTALESWFQENTSNKHLLPAVSRSSVSLPRSPVPSSGAPDSMTQCTGLFIAVVSVSLDRERLFRTESRDDDTPRASTRRREREDVDGEERLEEVTKGRITKISASRREKDARGIREDVIRRIVVLSLGNERI